ncbi:aldehyde dehydrogenase family protein [Mesorhizobium sp. B3-1-9]|uniref:aldehyde dehydrogenase family protein n=1 Tax=Mesorhizobium sp. B3-1-9 TaxID=2589892 RepID=UPI00112A9B93|nr:aldehyde dehydrogenase family protein [Mesorhizobium sp. B3-1-9]TPI38223.1 aldehyde dehydrogenase family protein [Mesorhizobium sp. B3-1-9]
MNDFCHIINGVQVTARNHFNVYNPSTAAIAGRAPEAEKTDIDNAVSAARAAFEGWSRTSNEVRKKAVHDAANAIEKHLEELATLLTLEQGKPLGGMGSRFELAGAMAWTRYTADLELPVQILQDNDEGRVELHRKPLGVVGSITPWNWPLMIACWHIMPAIRAGNTVVVKPSPYTPLSTIRMVEILNGCLPAGVVNVVAGQDNVGHLISEHAGISKLVFTGSTSTGKKVMRSASDTLKRLTLELGGNDAGIVLPDVDPAAIAEGLFWGAFINSGQTCAAMKRLYVHADVHDAVCENLVSFAAKVTMGDGMDEANLLGPIQNRAQFDKVTRLVEDAKTRGGKVLLGGSAKEGPGHFYPITLISGLANGDPLVDEEQFGPVLPIIRYADVNDAIREANNSVNGLGGSVWSRDVREAKRIASHLECGSVWINKHGAIQPNAPFGGVKSSGIGVEFGQLGLEENSSVQVIFS